jgi:hypothetical protein
MTARVAVFNLTVAMTGRPPELPAGGAAEAEAAVTAPEPELPSLADAMREGGTGAGNRLERYVDAMADLAAPLTLALAAAGAIAALVRRDASGRAGLLWAALVLVEVSIVGWVQTRYLIYLGPALWLLAVVPLALSAARRWKAVWAVGLAVAVGQQAFRAAELVPAGAAGYEDAAAFVAARPGRPVLYSAIVDSGYFVFFVRKHDPSRQSVVLRADKLLTTSRMGELNVSDRISAPGQVMEVLRACGVRYVVSEDGAYPGGPLTWLQEALRSPLFAERQRFPLRSRDARLAGRSIVVYELLDAPAPRPDYVLQIGIPLVGRTVSVRLADLLPGPRP